MTGNIFIANLISMVAFSAVNCRSYQQVNFKINSVSQTMPDKYCVGKAILSSLGSLSEKEGMITI